MSRFPPHPLTKAQAHRLIAVACDGTKIGIRNQAICVILYRTGVRCRELCSMQMDDVYPLDGECMMIRVCNPKGYGNGAIPRELGIDRRSSGYVLAWLAVRGNGVGPLFITRSGEPVLPSYIRQMMPRLAKRAGMRRRVHPHAFRHTFARELYDEKLGIMEIMMAMGHSSLTTTQNYLRSIGATEVVNATRKRSW